MNKEKIKNLLANYEQRLADSGHALTDPTLDQLKRKIEELREMLEFTDLQMRQYLRYEVVRAKGEFNMFDQNARILTGMSEGEYIFVMKNYAALKEAAESNQSKQQHTKQ